MTLSGGNLDLTYTLGALRRDMFKSVMEDLRAREVPVTFSVLRHTWALSDVAARDMVIKAETIAAFSRGVVELSSGLLAGNVAVRDAT